MNSLLRRENGCRGKFQSVMFDNGITKLFGIYNTKLVMIYIGNINISNFDILDVTIAKLGLNRDSIVCNKILAKIYYVKPSCSLLAVPTGGTFEMGTTIVAPLEFTWTPYTDIITQMSVVGSMLIIALGLNMMGLTRLKVMNYLPAIFLPLLLCLIF